MRESGNFFALRERKRNVEENPVSFVMAMVESGCLSTIYTSANKAKTTMTDQSAHKNPDAVTIVTTAKSTQTRPFE